MTKPSMLSKLSGITAKPRERQVTGRTNYSGSQASQSQAAPAGVKPRTANTIGSKSTLAQKAREKAGAIEKKIEQARAGEYDLASRPFTPTDHALTRRPRLEDMGLYTYKIDPAMNEITEGDELFRSKRLKAREFASTFPKKYVEYSNDEPETMKFDQTLATDKVAQREIAKTFVTNNRSNMWMYSTNFVDKRPGEIVTLMTKTDNFPGMMDELKSKERAYHRGPGSKNVTSCLSMPKKLITPELQNDDWLATLGEKRTAREERMNVMFASDRGHRIKEFNRNSIKWGN